MSGHSKWANIKHRKGTQDAKKAKIFTRLAKAIVIATQNGGGDVEKNSNLKLAIDQARKVNMPKENIQRAIQRGSGQNNENKMEEVIYEAYFSTDTNEMIAMMILCATDNKNRTISEIKSLLKKNGGKFVPNGSVSFNFNEVGQFKIEVTDIDSAELDIIEVGAKDLKICKNEITVFTEKSDLQVVYDNLSKKGYKIKNPKINYTSKQVIKVNKKTIDEYQKLYNIIDEQGDVQEIFDNIKTIN